MNDELLEKEAELGDIVSLFELGMKYLIKGEQEKCFMCIFKAMEQVHLDEQYKLAGKYIYGDYDSIKQDKPKGIKILERLSELGHYKSQFELFLLGRCEAPSDPLAELRRKFYQ